MRIDTDSETGAPAIATYPAGRRIRCVRARSYCFAVHADMTDDLDRRCEAFGIALSYRDIWGEEHGTPEATKRALLDAMHAGDPSDIADDASIPRSRRCHMPDAGARLFGPAIQLYALRSRRNWGVGDFTDLATFARRAATQGASFVGVNPLHELFLDRPAQASPYSPSTRLALNPLYLDVEAMDDFHDCADARALVASAAFATRVAALRASELIDYAGAWSAKREVLDLLFARFAQADLAGESGRAREFREFVASQRAAVYDAALFDALQAHFVARDPSVWGWPAWPAGYRHRASADVAAFERDHASAVDFYLYLQWQADLQLARAHAAARDAGMSIGLYRDLAVGANPGGAETWQEPRLFANGVHVGAPPDDFNRKGQDWGLPPWIPHELRASRFASFLALVRANMRHAGALRIDHVMGLARLYWIPQGMSPEDGAYVRYPLDDLCALLAEESARQRCSVVGEDLGTVPDTLRGTLRETGVFSYRVLFFERTEDGEFAPPEDYPPQALVSVSTHDLPTLRGFIEGTDLAHRSKLALFPSDALRNRLYAERDRDRAALQNALAHAHLTRDDVAVAVHRYVARTPCALMTVQLEDVFGEAEQANLPATLDDQHPNWRRKVGIDLEDWEADGRFARVCAAVRGKAAAGKPYATSSFRSVPSSRFAAGRGGCRFRRRVRARRFQRLLGKGRDERPRVLASRRGHGRRHRFAGPLELPPVSLGDAVLRQAQLIPRDLVLPSRLGRGLRRLLFRRLRCGRQGGVGRTRSQGQRRGGA